MSHKIDPEKVTYGLAHVQNAEPTGVINQIFMLLGGVWGGRVR